jgi:hypothetical protein
MSSMAKLVRWARIVVLGCLVTISSAKNQCIILAEFHDDTSKEGLWHHACDDGWGVANDCCKWNPAITCDANGQVVALNLRGCGIRGQLGQLLTIPTLVNVSLDSNSLYGPLPTDMSSAKALRSISAYGNTLSGVLDSLKAASSLVTLDLHFNNFTGGLSFANNLIYLAYLSLANNGLTGPIPQQWSSLTKLSTLGLAYNKLSGNLTVLGSMPELAVIFLRNNTPGFFGSLPKLPKYLKALFIDGNPLLNSLDTSSICASAPVGGFKPGCKTDWPSASALNACCRSA